jgi:succinate dehydrogenase/fumarate reductase cytochrome b subunit
LHTVGKGCTAKALIVGLIGAICIGLGSPYNNMMIKGSAMDIWNVTPAATFLFFLLVAIVNVLLRLLHRRLALERGELAVAYFLMLVANTLPGRGFSGFILPVITGAFYYATPENNWSRLIQPYLPGWAGPQDHEVIQRFYEGDPGQRVLWGAWLTPLLYWLVFALALFLVMACMMVILRRQWVEHERLAYPMVQLPLAMIEDDPKGSLIKPLFRSGVMWLGFAVPFVTGTINAFHNYYSPIPSISFGVGGFSLFRGTVGVSMSMNPTLVGFSYFVHRDVAFGLCFFYLLNTIQQGIFNITGLQGREEVMGVYSQYTGPIIIHQAMGGMIALVLMTLWVGRRHLIAVVRKAFRGDPTVDDSKEILSYRSAVFGTLVGLVAMGFYLWRTGVPLPFVPMLLFGAFMLFLTISRVVAQGGVASMFPPTNAPDFVVSGVGTSALGPTGLGGLALTYAWATDVLILLMSACANGLKLVGEVRLTNQRRLFGGIVATIVLTLISSIGLILYLSYQHGAINLDQYYFNNAAHYPYWFMERGIGQPSGPNLRGWVHVGVGAAVMVGLMVAQLRFPWWPFHPLGFPISCVFGRMWFSVFVAWLIKGVALKYGGPGLYSRMKPFFLGLILGEAVVGGVWILIDYFTGMTNNNLGGFMA